MTLDEKLAAQTLIINEITATQETNPTLLIDALLTDQGYQFLHMVLAKHAAQAAQVAQMTNQLMRALRPAKAETDREAS